MQFGFSRRKVVRHASSKARRHAPKRRRLFFDGLEDRRVLSSGTLATSPLWTSAPAQGESGAQTTNGGVYDVSALPASLTQLPTEETSPRSVATFGDGNSVVTWADQLGDGTFNLMFRQYDASGNAAGQATTVANSNEPAIMVAAQQTSSAGNFVLVWTDVVAITTGQGKHASTTSSYQTHLQVYNSSGNATGASAELTSSQAPTSVAMDASGNFDLLYATQDGWWNVQRYNNNAVPQGSVITVAHPTLLLLTAPKTAAIAADPSGDFVVSWYDVVATSTHDKGTWTTHYTPYMYAEKFNSAGTPDAQGVITVQQGLTDAEDFGAPNVGMDASGDFAVTWVDVNYNLTSLAYGSVYARVFHADGSSSSAKNEVPDSYVQSPSTSYYTALTDEVPAVVVQPGGAFDLAWTARQYPVTDSSGNTTAQFGVYAQPFDSLGNATQPPIAIDQSTVTTIMVGYVSAALDSNNDLLVAYSLNPGNTAPSGFSTATDGDIYLQFIPDPPVPATTTASSPSPSTTSGAALAAGSTTAATDAVFGGYAYPEGDDSLA